MLYSTNQLDDIEEAVQWLEEQQEPITLENINNWLDKNVRRPILFERIDDILIDLGYC